MDVIWNLITGVLWQTNQWIEGLGSFFFPPILIAVNLLGWVAACWAFWKLGAGDYRQVLNAVMAASVLSGIAFFIGAEQPILSWILSIPACTLALLAGRDHRPLTRWQARIGWIPAALGIAWLLPAGAIIALTVSLFAWIAGWSSRRMPLRYRSWVLPETRSKQ